MRNTINGRISEYLYRNGGKLAMAKCNEMERAVINIMALALGGSNVEAQKMALNQLEEAVRR